MAKEKLGSYPRADLLERLKVWRESHVKTKQSPYEIWLLDEAMAHLEAHPNQQDKGS
jgi:hypothetical protein